MSVELNHTIVWARDPSVSARFLAGLLGLQVGPRDGPFLPITLDNAVTLDFGAAADKVAAEHYAFVLSHPSFDAALDRIRAQNLDCFVDPFHIHACDLSAGQPAGGAVYLSDPDGHNVEIIDSLR